MLIIGADYLTSLLSEGSFSAKMVFNANGAIMFPVSQEHRDQKAPGISYEDGYQGNALAAMLAPGKIEIRGHRIFRTLAYLMLFRYCWRDQNWLA